MALGFAILSCFCNLAAAQTDTTRAAHAGTVVYGFEQLSSAWRWMSKYVGGDLFLAPGYYRLHLTGGDPLIWDLGPGAELRIHPVFVGGEAGWCGNDGIPSLDMYSSFYLGVMAKQWRIELGQINATGHDDKGNETGAYVADFLGVGRRFGRGLFFEPEVKIMYPIVSHSWNYAPGNYANGSSGVTTQEYHLRDLYFSLSLKLGFGFN